MITAPSVSPAHPGIAAFRALRNFASLNVTHETGIRAAFQSLLQTVAQENKMTLVTEQTVEGTKVRPDGTLRDGYNLPRGYWESKRHPRRFGIRNREKEAQGLPVHQYLV